MVMLAPLGLVLLLAGPAQIDPAVRRAPARAGLSWAEADALAEVLDQVDRRFKAGKPPRREPLVVTEVQLNSYLNLTLGPKLPPGISELEVQMTGGGLLVQGKVDLDRVPLKRPTDGFSLLRFVSGVVPVVLSGGLRGQDGQGSIDLREAHLSGISLPIALVAQLVSTASRSAELPQGFDIYAPFPLPYAMRRVRFEPGRAVVEFQ